MIEISAMDSQFSQLCNNDYRYFDRNIYGNTHYYMGGPNTRDALLPLVVNDIDLKQNTYVIDDDINISDYKKFMLEQIDHLSETKLCINRTYCFGSPDITAIDRSLNDIGFELMPEVILNLYKKAIEQCIARDTRPQDFPEDWFIHPYIAKEKHMIVIVTNVHDTAQASDQYLTYGLIPVLYKDYAEKFSPEEITYFKTWVSRSQVKRISNVNVVTAFREMESSEKYKEAIINSRRTYIIRELVRSRLYNAEQQAQRSERDAEHALQNYQAHLVMWRRSNDLVKRLTEDTDETIKLFTQALACKEIVNLQSIDTDGIDITLRDAVKFYDPEEADLALKNKDKDDWCTRLFTDIFIKQKYKLYVAATYRFYIDPNNTTSICHSGGMLNYFRNWDAMFNPHIFYYACLGDYQPQLVKAKTEQDILLFITLALASTKSINFRDGAVINRWYENLKDLWNNNNNPNSIFDAKCLEDTETGDKLSIRTYITQLSAVELDVTDTLEDEEL